jgi:RNA polymerase sigma-70 factor (ECF subfamily)
MTAATDRDGPHRQWLAETYARLHEQLWCYVRRRSGGDGQRASDIVQEAFVQLCQQPWPEIEPYATAWLYRTCRNRAIDVGRREGRMTAAFSSGQQPPDVTTLADRLGHSPPEQADQRERLERLGIELARLSDQQQEILRLRLHSGLSYKQIAEVMELTVSNVGYHLHQAIVTLRDRLS